MTKMKFNEIDLPPGLEKKILAKIEMMASKEILKRKILGGFSLAVSIFAFLEFSLYLVSETKKSGFIDYVSLLLSDYKIVLGNFSSYILSVVDSIPFLAVTLAMVSILAIMASARYLAGAAKFEAGSDTLTA